MIEILDLTLPVEESNDPNLLKDLEIHVGGRVLARVRLHTTFLSFGIGEFTGLINYRHWSSL